MLLGYVVSEKGRKLDSKKIAVIDGLATPSFQQMLEEHPSCWGM